MKQSCFVGSSLSVRMVAGQVSGAFGPLVGFGRPGYGSTYGSLSPDVAEVSQQGLIVTARDDVFSSNSFLLVLDCSGQIGSVGAIPKSYFQQLKVVGTFTGGPGTVIMTTGGMFFGGGPGYLPYPQWSRGPIGLVNGNTYDLEFS